eukprot:2436340-Lingulodinium_polyedra.AAC.1
MRTSALALLSRVLGSASAVAAVRSSTYETVSSGACGRGWSWSQSSVPVSPAALVGTSVRRPCSAEALRMSCAMNV